MDRGSRALLRQPDQTPSSFISLLLSFQKIHDHATSSLGFDLVGVAPAARLAEEGGRLEEWIAAGRHGSMEWMARDSERRIDVRRLLPSARSVIVVAKNYYTPRHHAERPDIAKVSRYAWGRDYHNILPKRLKRLARFIAEEEPGGESRWFVDAGPVMEKAWAVRAGIGWLGKHTNVITRSHGSWVFLGALVTSAEFDRYTPSIPDFCGDCVACIDACPTDAIFAPYQLDATLCLSYITIEQKPKGEEIPDALARKMEGWAFGCDICQDVCPWSSFQQPTDETDFEPRAGMTDLSIDELESMTDQEFDDRFQGTPVRRATATGIRRNARALRRSV